ncbi:MAG: M23 family metallopeptidase [Bacteroidia bacterium]
MPKYLFHYIAAPFLLFILFLTSAVTTCAQDRFPMNYFINPLDVPIKLAGTFGEIRSNHFHTGLDIETEQREGLVVHAAADGYVSRINVSPFGYGNALYITHPNGYVTVYGHLSRYNDIIMKYLRKVQYERHQFSVDIQLKPGEIPVKKGDTVAFSGSTGAAEGPHVHFEIRDEKTEDPINPMLFGLTTIDHEAPVIRGICIYPLNDSSNVTGRHTPLYIKAAKREKGYVPETDSVIHVYGKIGVGVSTYDMGEEGSGHNGPYSQLLLDGSDTIYLSKMDELSFGSIHYVNGHVDYKAFKKDDRTIEHSFQADNDALEIYKKISHRGRITCKNGQTHHLKYVIGDFNGNLSSLPFTLQSDTKPGTVFHDSLPGSIIIHWRRDFDYEKKGMLLHLPPKVLFEDTRFHCTVDTTSLHVYSAVYNVGDKYTPFNNTFSLSIKPSAPLPDSLMRHAVIVQIDGKHVSSLGGTYENGYMVAHPKNFGSFAIMMDMERPVIRPINIYKNKDMSKSSSIEFEITDDLSGIANYSAYVDDHWILMEFNPKKNMIYYTFDEHVDKGKHHLKLVVVDNVGNTNIYQTDFIR